MKTFKVMFVIAAAFSVQTAFGLERELINNALNETLMERASIEKAYEQNPAAVRPHAQKRVKSGRIEVVIDSGIAGSGSSLKNHSSEEVYREKRVQVKLDKELEAVEKDLAVTPKETNQNTNLDEILN